MDIDGLAAIVTVGASELGGATAALLGKAGARSPSSCAYARPARAAVRMMMAANSLHNSFGISWPRPG